VASDAEGVPMSAWGRHFSDMADLADDVRSGGEADFLIARADV
jgi:hypothetical protein